MDSNRVWARRVGTLCTSQFSGKRIWLADPVPWCIACDTVSPMSTVPIRELRNNGGAVADRVLAGEQVTVTHAGKPIMELVPVPRVPLSAEALLARWRNLEPVDGMRLRHDLAAILDETV